MKKNKKLLDWIGAGCGVFLVLALIVSIVLNAVASAPPKGSVTATGSGNGIDGPVVVQVTADAERIHDVQVLEQNETVGIGSVAVEKLPGAIVEANSLMVDGIAGATVTSTAIKDGVREALTKAGLDPSVFEVEPTWSSSARAAPA